MKKLFFRVIFAAALLSCRQQPTLKPSSTMNTENTDKQTTSAEHAGNPYYSRTDIAKLNVPDEEWKKILPADVYSVARQAGTERAFTGKYWNTEGLGNYYCAVCGNKLFRADQKFASSCGWPSFFEPSRKDAVAYHKDQSHGMSRIEVTCGRCGSHLGHVFDDGPKPTGLRYCMNSIVLDFEPDNALNPEKP
ncbi:peptide-methionine (R)-S-oxide reductase MsrB [Adhaeribacter soli]|uniref:peptide-methionine (R)-S-oxide reductase n=1 Tax=Adhaeribacter soli TaxID=2607655 RepID=A0A5N1J1J5_9BACT|nr:peptide-methionine (R)-S-oxide reductase MsrB [Adhaeribacter soli]KAA9340618.1 peptide-methionine (R)-S-oxide reductase MsrB [Adhaeribacter soli]